MKTLLLTLFIALQTLAIADQKITCDLRGGLGNQLFQIVSTSAHGWDHGYTPVFERISHSPTRVGKRPVYVEEMDGLFWAEVDYVEDYERILRFRGYKADFSLNVEKI